MSHPAPKVSIVCPSYNHEKYVGAFIQSILSQSEQDFEILIIDDCSSDNNVVEILKFSDPRIRLFEHTFNMGISASINEGIKRARSGIIALLASDDLARPDYLEKVLKTFEAMADVSAIYVQLQHIDRDGNLLEHRTKLPVDLNRFEILRRSFFGENQLPSPGMAIRKKAALEALLPIGSIQYSDWILHNNLLLRNEIFLLDEPLILYRKTPGSVSTRSAGVVSREKLEVPLLMDCFLAIEDVSLLECIFREDLLPEETLTKETIPYILSKLALRSPVMEKRHWGHTTLARFISVPGVQEMLYDIYKFDYKNFMTLVPMEDGMPPLNPSTSKEIISMKRKLRRLKRSLLLLILFSLTILYVHFA
jgi:glycosyltransferase involved in cell wall biosynthesis